MQQLIGWSILLIALAGWAVAVAQEGEKPQPIRVEEHGGDPPRILKSARVVYPLEAREQRVEGIVTLEVVVEPDERVTEVNTLRPAHILLVQATLEAIRQMQFQPGTLEGKPVRALMTLTFRFQLGERERD